MPPHGHFRNQVSFCHPSDVHSELYIDVETNIRGQEDFVDDDEAEDAVNIVQYGDDEEKVVNVEVEENKFELHLAIHNCINL